MNTNSSFSTRGEQPKPQTSESASTPDLKQSESFGQKSNSQSPALPKTEGSKLEAVKSLFRGEQQDEPQSQDDDASYLDSLPKSPLSGETQQPDTQNGSVKKPDSYDPISLAETLGIKPEQLYKQLQISLGDDGETLTLGELKDRVQSQRQAALETTQRERALDEREASLLHNQQLLAQIGQQLEGKLPPQLVQEVQQRQRQHEAAQNRLMYETMPELRDKQNFERFRNGVIETLQPFGFRPQDMNIQDHRILLVLRDYMRTKAQLQRLMEFEPKQERIPPKQHKPQGNRPKQSRADRLTQQARNGSEAQKAAAISAIIRGK